MYQSAIAEPSFLQSLNFADFRASAFRKTDRPVLRSWSVKLVGPTDTVYIAGGFPQVIDGVQYAKSYVEARSMHEGQANRLAKRFNQVIKIRNGEIGFVTLNDIEAALYSFISSERGSF